MNVSSIVNKLHEDEILDTFPNFGVSNDAHLVQGLLLSRDSVFWGKCLDVFIKKLLPIG